MKQKYLVRWDEDENGKKTYQYSSDKYHKKTDKRYAWQTKCTKCKLKPKVGGLSLQKSIDSFRSFETYHESICDGTLKTNKTYHATEVPHIYAEQTTQQTHTGDANWTDVSGAILPSASFTVGNKYFIMVTCTQNGTNSNTNFGAKVVHGATDFADSDKSFEPASNATTTAYSYTYFTVWTAVASEDIKLQHITINTSQIIKTDRVTMTAIDLTTDFTEDVDWHYDSNSTSTGLTTTFSTTNNASITIDASDHGNETIPYLVMGLARIDSASTSTSAYSRIERTGEVTENGASLQQEGEDTVDFFNHFTSNIYDLGNASNTFTQKSATSTGTAFTRTHSAIFSLNITLFKLWQFDRTASFQTTTSTDFANLIATMNFSAGITGDHFIIASNIGDTTGSSMQNRVQLNNVDQPLDQSSFTNGISPWDTTDQLNWSVSSVESLQGEQFYSLDFGSSSTNFGVNYVFLDVYLLVFSFELEISTTTSGGVFDVAVFGDATQFDTVTDWTVNILANHTSTGETVSYVPAYLRVILETTVITDLAERAWHNARAMVEPAITVGADVLSTVQGLFRNPTEVIPVGEVLAKSQVLGRIIAEPVVTVGEVLTRTLSNIRTIAEPVINVLDGVTGVRGELRTIAEPAVIVGADIVNAVKVNVRNLAELVNVVDIVDRVYVAVRSLNETITVGADVASIGKAVSAVIAEPAVVISDSVARFAQMFRTVTEPSTSISDILGRAGSIIRGITEPATVIGDAVGRVVTMFRSISEPTISITDNVVFNAFLQLVLTFPTRIKDSLTFGTIIKEDLNFSTRIKDTEDSNE